MTGYIKSHPDPLSAVTIASAGDFGFHVDVTKADLYPPPAPASAPTAAAATMVLHGPKATL